MRFAALATDYDGTLAHDGRVNQKTLDALTRFKDSGRKLILVTGRRLDDLFHTFDSVQAFDLVVAENGALLYDPVTKAEQPIGEPPPPEFGASLKSHGVPFEAGQVIVATWDNYKASVLQVIADSKLELQMIFNKGALMILPAGVNKATGLDAALAKLGLSRHNVVGIGDAENDHAFLSACEYSVAVSNALDSLKQRSDFVTGGDHGDGVIELIDLMLKDDLASLPQGDRHRVLLGQRDDGSDLAIPAHGVNLLLAGPSGAGKSTLMTGIMERLVGAGFQLCVIDPEGDYQSFPKSVVLGDAAGEPPVDQVLQTLKLPENSAIANLMGVQLERRPDYLERLLPALVELRAQVGRPHWLVLDEAHHMAPVERQGEPMPTFSGILAATLDPGSLNRSLLEKFDYLIAVGDSPSETITSMQPGSKVDVPHTTLEKGEALLWSRSEPQAVVRFKVAPCQTPRTRHSRKYAEAMLTPDRSFYFQGPKQELNLRASNLITFVQMMEGVDDATFAYHLERKEYSKWFRDNIKNEDLADEAALVEAAGFKEASREAIRKSIEERYTLPG